MSIHYQLLAISYILSYLIFYFIIIIIINSTKAMTTQYHLLRISLQIRKISLSVRFPCSVQFQLKNDTNIVDGRMAYELRDGKCEPNQKLVMDVEVPTKQSEYAEKKISLVVLIASSTGKTPAGSVQLKITQKGKIVDQSNGQNFSIQKCPDKSASIEATLKVQYIRSIQRSSPSSSFGYGLPQKNRLITSSSQSIYQRIGLISMKDKSKKMVTPDKYKNKNYLTQTDSPKIAVTKTRNGQADYLEEGSIIEQELLLNEPDSFYHHKILKLSKQKQSYAKQLSKLRAEIHTLRRQEIKNGNSEDQITKYRYQIDSLTQQLTLTKQKLRNLQRKQKQLSTQNRDYKDQVEKFRSKTTSIESMNQQSKISIEEKQRNIRKLLDEIKLLKEEIQEMKMNINMQDKRIEYKESSSRDQIQKLTQKYQQSQFQRQKAILDLNNMLSDFESKQKKSQLLLKQKQRSHTDQRSKLLKKIQTLSISLSSLTEQSNQQKSTLSTLTTQSTHLQRQKQSLTLQLNQVKTQLQQIRIVNKKNESTIQEMAEQIVMLQIQDKQLGVLNRKYGELVGENGRNLENLARKEQKMEAMGKQIKDMEAIIKETNIGREGLQVKNLELGKEITRMKKIIESKEIQISGLQENVNSLNSKLSQMRMKLQTQKMQSQNMRNKAQSQIIYLIRSKDQLAVELDQQKQKTSKSQQSCSTLSSKISSLNTHNLKLSQQLLSTQQKSTTLQSTIHQLENKISLMGTQLLAKQAKEKQFVTILRERNDTEFELKKVIKDLQRESFLAKEREKMADIGRKDMEGVIEVLAKERDEANERIAKLMETGANASSQYTKNFESFNLKIKNISQDNQHLKLNISDIKKIIAIQEIQISQKTKKISQLDQKLLAQTKRQQQQKAKLSQKQSSFTKLKQQWQTYRSQTASALQQFLTQISKQPILRTPPSSQPSPSSSPSNSKQKVTTSITKSQVELLTFPDPNLSLLQIQALKKKQEQTNKYREEIQKREGEILMISMEMERIKRYAKEREEELEVIVEGEKQRYKKSLEEWMTQKNGIIDNLRNGEQKNLQMRGQIQKNLLQLSRIRQQNQSLQKQLSTQKSNCEILTQKIKLLTKQLESLSNTQSTYKSTTQNEYLVFTQENKSQIDKYKNNIKQLQKKIQKMENSLTDQEEYSRGLESQLSELQHQKEKLEKKCQFGEEKYAEILQQKIGLENNLHSMEKLLKQQAASFTAVSAQLNASNYKVQTLTLSNKKLTQNIETIQAQLSTLQLTHSQSLESHTEQLVAQKKQIQTQTQQLQKLSQSQKQQSQILISQKSQLDLKSFIISQLESTVSQLKSTNSQLSQQLLQKKSILTSTQLSLQNLQNQLILLSQSLQSVTKQKNTLQIELKKQREKIEETTKQLLEYSFKGEILDNREKQIERMKFQIGALEGKIQEICRQGKQREGELRKEIGIRVGREQEMKRRVRQLEKQLSQKVYEMNNENERNRDQMDRERLEIVRSLELLESQNNRLRSQCQYVRQQFSRQIQQVNQDCAQLTRLLTEKQEMLVNKSDQVKQNEKKIKMLSNQLKNCLQAWQREKTELRFRGAQVGENGQLNIKFQKLIDQIDSRSRNLQGRAK